MVLTLVVMSVFRLAILGGDFVVNEDSAWDTTIGFGFFTFIFNVVMCVNVPVTLTLHNQSAVCARAVVYSNKPTAAHKLLCITSSSTNICTTCKVTVIRP